MRRFLLLAISVALALIAQENLQGMRIATDSVLLYAAAVVPFLLAVAWGQRREAGATITGKDTTSGRPLNGWNLLVPVSSLAPMAAALLAWNENGFATPQSTYILLIYLAGMALFCYGIRELSKAEGNSPTTFPAILSPRAELLVVACICAIGAFMLFWQLGALPFGVWYDESDSALEALQILAGAPYSPVAFHFQFNPSLYFHYVAVVFRFFGAGVEQIRFASASTGLLAIPGMYLLAKGLFGQRVAVVAAFLLAVSRWQFDFARWGMFFVASTVFVVLSVHFLLRALHHRRWSDFACAGLFLGGGLQTYTAFRSIPVAAVAIASYWVLTQNLIPAARGAGFGGVSDELKALIPRFVVLLVAALVALGPFGLFAVQNPDVINQRLEEASVFARKETTEQKLQALGGNIEKHLLMLNYRGDNNGRHNLPGEPMLDPTTGAFFILGVSYAVYRWRDPIWVSLLLWLAVGLQGGILSLDFEAPQAVRTLPVVPVVCLLAAWPLARTWEEMRAFARSWASTVKGRRAAGMAVCVLLTLGLFRIGYYNYHTYFVRQANDFAVWNAYSTPETLVARRANALGDGYSYYIADFIGGHPTMRFLAPWLQDYKSVSSDMVFPLYQSGDRPVAVFLDAQKSVAFNAGRRYYASGDFREIRPPFGGPVALYEILLTPEDIRSVQGMNARYYQGAAWQGQPLIQRKEPRLEADWRAAAPVAGPFSVEWTGTLYVPSYGADVLALTAPAEAQVFVDETPFLSVGASGGTVEKAAMLAKGNHALRVRAVGGAGSVRLAWQLAGGARETIPQVSLYVPPVAANGLLGSYYRGLDWAGAPALRQVDPSLALYFHVTPLPRPYSVEWIGKLSVPIAGTYALGLESIDDSWLYLDGGAAPVVEAHVGNQYVEAKLNLAAGLHDIRVLFVDKSGYSHINLSWTPPGGSRETIPSERLYPPQGAYPAPTPATPMQGGSPAPLTFQASWGGTGEAPGEFREPRDIAVDSKGTIYVADTGNHRVQRLDRNGKQWSVMDGAFEEPLALVVDSHDNLIVLDSPTGWLYRFDATGAALGRMGGPAAQLYHPRGMAIDADDNLFVADTGGCRIVKFSPDGAVTAKIGSKGAGRGQFLEPTDVAVQPNGLMFVADSGNKRIVRLDAAGSYLGEWAFRQAAPLNGPHLALAPGGLLLVTDPEGGRLVTFEGGGRQLQESGRRGSADGEFRLPVGLTVDGEGRVYVADTGNSRVQLLAP
jgi:DNA-binding beta-propeller fold protein YncE